jgi:hypothetical protein
MSGFWNTGWGGLLLGAGSGCLNTRRDWGDKQIESCVTSAVVELRDWQSRPIQYNHFIIVTGARDLNFFSLSFIGIL